MIGLRADDPPAAALSLVAGLAVWRAVTTAAPGMPGLQIKWPNDLLVGPAKLGGILLERSGGFVICGIGVNVGWAPDVPGRATTSLANFGHRLSVDSLAALLAEHFAAALHDWRTQPMAALRDAWLDAAHPLGTVLSRQDANGSTLTGRFDGLEEDGSLRLLTGDDTLVIISSGEILLG